MAQILWKQAREMPESPTVRLGAAVSEDLETLILRCLSKRKEDRPGTMFAVIEGLSACRSSGTWTAADAESWWRTHVFREEETALMSAGAVAVADATVTIDVARRGHPSPSPRAMTTEHGGPRGEA